MEVLVPSFGFGWYGSMDARVGGCMVGWMDGCGGKAEQDFNVEEDCWKHGSRVYR